MKEHEKQISEGMGKFVLIIQSLYIVIFLVVGIIYFPITKTEGIKYINDLLIIAVLVILVNPIFYLFKKIIQW